MGFVSITKDEAKFAHQHYYDGDFEVVLMNRSGPADFPPFSFVYGASDIGSWEGLISTDGKKVVVTKSSWKDVSKVKDVFEFSMSDVVKVKNGMTKLEITLDEPINGLTKDSGFVRFLFIFMLITAPLVLLRSSKKVRFRLKNEFKNLENFKKMIGAK